MAYDKTHKKDYHQLNIKLDYERDADVIEYMRHALNKHDVVLNAIRCYMVCEECQDCYCHTDGFIALLEARR